MEKTAFMFPGVGSQYPQMGKYFYDNFKCFENTMQEAEDIAQIDIKSLIFDSSKKEQLSRLDNAQLIITAMSVALFRVYMEEIGIPPAFGMGHSLGEYAALCCSGVLRFDDTIRLIKKRSQIIGTVSQQVGGTMMWVINLDYQKVEEIVNHISNPAQDKAVFVSAYDCPTQTSISGHNDAVMTVAREAEQAGAIVYPLKMSGPFHCPLMIDAVEWMKSELFIYPINDFSYPVISNRTAKPYEGKSQVIENLSHQLISPIHWMSSVRFLVEQGVTSVIEIGPKDVLKFLVKKNTNKITPYSIDRDFSQVMKQFLIQEEEYLPLVGKCLGVVVSTKNRNDDLSQYKTHVAEPYYKIETLYRQWTANGQSPTRDQVIHVLNTLPAILNARNVPQSEQHKRFARLLGGKTIKGLDIHALGM